MTVYLNGYPTLGVCMTLHLTGGRIYVHHRQQNHAPNVSSPPGAVVAINFIIKHFDA